MTRKIQIIIAILIASCSVMAQSDQAAISVLDKFSNKAISSPSVSMKFTLLVHDAVEETDIESKKEKL